MDKPKAEKAVNTATPVAAPPAGGPRQGKRVFEIFVEEMHEGEDGVVRWRPVMVDPRLGGNGQVTLTVDSPEDLKSKQALYRSAGQRFRIIRELTPPPPRQLNVEWPSAGQKPVSAQVAQTPQPPPAQSQTPPPPPPAPKKPKIVTIGDIQVKYDGDDVYQRQWVRLQPKEEKNVRIVNDATNKIVPMKNRHVEVRRWVKVEGGSVLDGEED